MEIAQPLPASLDAERAVLAACLVNPDAAVRVSSSLQAEDFSLLQHKLIFQGVQLLQAQGISVELPSLVEALAAVRKLDAAGGAAYVASITDGVPRVTGVSHFCQLIKGKAKLRRLIHAAQHIQQQAFNPTDQSADAVIEGAVSEILGISADSGPILAREWSDVAAHAVMEFAEAFHNPDVAKRISFGLADLDETVGGLRRKELVSIVAPTSNGKTLLAAQCAFRADRDGFKVLFFSAEMPAEEVAMREIAFQADVPFYYTRRPEKANAEQLRKLQEASRVDYSVRIVDHDITPARIWAMAEAMKRSSGLDLVILDYDQLAIEAGMNPASEDDNIFRHQRAFIFAAKRLAERLNITFIFLSQLRKLSPAVLKGAQPHLDDIWGDSSVRNTPHLVMWLSREFFINGQDPAFERRAKVYVLKNRSGRTGVVDLDFDPQRLRFLDAQPNEADSVSEAQWQRQFGDRETIQ